MSHQTHDATPSGGEPPLHLPYYRAPVTAAVRRFFLKYATFRGRAGRAEYWWWVLVVFLVTVAVDVVYGLVTGSWAAVWDSRYTTGADVINGILSLAVLVPGLAVSWRRLHDTNRSGAWNFIALVPLVGWVVLLVMLVQAPVPAGQRYDQVRA